ncbi:MAG: hypothetical protein WC464_08290 [Bdellovibrionales bacterium]
MRDNRRQPAARPKKGLGLPEALSKEEVAEALRVRKEREREKAARRLGLRRSATWEEINDARLIQVNAQTDAPLDITRSLACACRMRGFTFYLTAQPVPRTPRLSQPLVTSASSLHGGIGINSPTRPNFPESDDAFPEPGFD